MSEAFDAYHKWLAIRPEHQPPDHYRLLGVAQFETDPDVISAAADQRMSHLRTFQAGPRGGESQRLLNEVSAAKVTLLHTEKKAAYDAKLRELQAQQSPVAPAAPMAAPVAPVPPTVAPPTPAAKPEPVAPELGGLFATVVCGGAEADPAKQRAGKRDSRDLAPWIMAAGAVVVGLIAIGVAAVMLPPGPEATTARKPPSSSAQPQAVESLEPLRKPLREEQQQVEPSAPTTVGEELGEEAPDDAPAPPPASAELKAEGPTTDELADAEPPDAVSPVVEWSGKVPPPAVAPFAEEKAKALQRAWAEYLDVPVAWEDPIGMTFVLIPPGEFTMGTSDEELAELLKMDWPGGKDKDVQSEGPEHRVVISRPFFMGATEVTQAQFEQITGRNPGTFSGEADLPVDSVSWPEAHQFCEVLSREHQRRYRLPSEAEWEYACRAGTTTRYCFGDDPAGFGEFGWYNANSNRTTHLVGQKRPNAWGLFDMHGNLSEWCSDWFRFEYFARSPKIDPQGPESGVHRVLRNNCWCSSAMRYGRSAFRARGASNSQSNHIGFRVVCEVPLRDTAAIATGEPAAPGDLDQPGVDDENGAPEPFEPEELLPVPPEEEQNLVCKEIDEIFKISETEDASAKRRLAAKLASLGDREDKPVERYVLWRQAAELYLAAGEAKAMTELIDRIADRYTLERLKAKHMLLLKLAEDADKEQQIKSLVDASAPVVDVAIAEEDIDLADELTAAVYRACMRSAGRPFRSDALQLRRRVQTLRDEFGKAAQARAALKENPEDPGANTLLGRYLCFLKGEWDQGLPLLAKSGAPGLAKAAEAELAGREGSDAQVELGDLWFELAAEEKKDSAARMAILARAAANYREALPRLGGVTRAAVLLKLKKIEAETGHNGDDSSGRSTRRHATPPVEIRAARYGVDGKWADVTEAVKRRHVPGDGLRITAVNELAGRDPAPYRIKRLEIVIQVAGVTWVESVREKRTLTLSTQELIGRAKAAHSKDRESNDR